MAWLGFEAAGYSMMLRVLYLDEQGIQQHISCYPSAPREHWLAKKDTIVAKTGEFIEAIGGQFITIEVELIDPACAPPTPGPAGGARILPFGRRKDPDN